VQAATEAVAPPTFRGVTTPAGLAATLSGLADRRRKSGSTCHFALTLGRLRAADPKAADALLQAVDDEAVSGADIARALSEYGYELPAYTVNRHRKRSTGNGCRCPK
jgi:hypothetical protein